MRGPAPLPTALNAARGYPGHRRKNPAEPQAVRLASLAAPPELPPAAVRIWEELAPIADRAGVLDDLGARLFATACRLQALGEAHLAVAECIRPGLRAPVPALATGLTCLEKAASLWARFGLDPSSRTRLRIGGGEGPTDELQAFRAAHPRRARQQAGPALGPNT